ncbi:MerR family transcriptional regulator [Lentzea flaviverrucosa]|uniref:MerR HTH family regulatory protein n=1 Tax=Lentzea flaviverrucosa TaxID=200379 RepID=A0A1H8ZXV6_9PSEU|nr:MerR family transcriptional regulator [Lentzea flaviverrucosa]RDI32220.1 MerR-like DNA binding protein [Lentzea flaviverrucosa]SEP69204.1 MerR HTH family regulatory protein [Lentzea flaviverrucosa]
MTYTPRAVAGMLGIAPTTLRTWDQRYGLGPSVRTDGGHRRYEDADVEVLRRMLALTAQGVAASAAAVLARKQPVAPPDGERTPIGSTEALTAKQGFLGAAKRLDEPAMADIAAKLLAAHGVVAAWDAVFVPALVELGELVVTSGQGVEIEHLASGSVLHALRGIPRTTSPAPLSMLLSCAPDEQHWLPLEALGAALSEQDHRWGNLGARVPAEALCDAVARLCPRVVLIWAHRQDLALRVPLEELGTRSGAVVAVAGSGWEGVALPSFVRRPMSLTEAIGLVADR